MAESGEEMDLNGLANLQEYSEIFNGLTEHHTINTGTMDLINIVISYTKDVAVAITQNGEFEDDEADHFEITGISLNSFTQKW